MTKFKIGDKVVPIAKSTGDSLERSNVWRKAQEKKQGFIYINNISRVGEIVCHDSVVGYKTGDFFKESDLIPYTEGIDGKKALALINKLEGLMSEAIVVIEALKDFQTQVSKTEPVVKNNNARKEIVDKAIEFVQKYRAVKKGDDSHTIGNDTAQAHWYDTEFIQKGNKVTALVHHLERGVKKQSNTPNRVGRAVCIKGDTFNRHIGEAIALGRALDINVDMFLNAVQPTEILVGQVVKGSHERESSHYSKNKTFTLKGKNGDSFYYKESVSDYIYPKQISVIVDDTNALYEV